MFFGHSRFTDPDVEDWAFQTWAWLMRHRDGMRGLAWTRLITPGPDAFPATKAGGPELAQHVLNCVVRAMKFGSIQCELQPVDRQARVAVSGLRGSAIDMSEVSGGHYTHNGRLVLEYERSLLDDPMRLVAVLAHQICRYEIGHISETPPGGRESLPLAADLAVAHRGMGIFGANAAFEFWAGTPGAASGSGPWRASYCGFLSEETWALGLAIFLALKGEDLTAVDLWLEPDIRSLTHDARRYLIKHPDLLQPLQAIV